jgi:hypothetical protein
MSSVRRVVSQRPSNLYYSNPGAYYYSYDEIVNMAVGEYLAVQNDNQFTFSDENACASTVHDLDYNADESNPFRLTNGNQTFTDMGKEIKFGVKGGQNDHFTLRLVQLRGLDSNIYKIGPTYNTFWVIVDSKTTSGMRTVLAGYGQVRISRA